MGRTRNHTRKGAHTYPRGVLDVRAEGYGFVVTPEGDFFIPETKIGGAFDGDLVEVSPLPRTRGKKMRGKQPGDECEGDFGSRYVSGQDRPAARVVRVLERSFDSLVGRYEVAEPFGVVVPEDTRLRHDVFTMRADNPDIPDGSLVRVRITTFPDKGVAATGVIEEVFGDDRDTGVLVDLIVARHKLETQFSASALDEASAATLDVEAALSEGYRDLRDRFLFTVDPVDARDFDDAVSLEPVGVDDDSYPSGVRWRLGVHIADVSRYVPWDCAIDLDARRRATSVYLADRVIPMLPERLSCDLCSLRPDEDRLSMTVDMGLSAEGALLGADVYPAVIRSKARLTYGQAQSLLEGGEPRSSVAGSASTQNQQRAFSLRSEEPYPAVAGALVGPLQDRLRKLSALAKRRIARRRDRGGIDIDAVEAKVRLDARGVPVGVDLRSKTEATSLIEEAMILANEAVAQYLASLGYPCAYRVHEAPDAAALEGLLPVLKEFPWFETLDESRLAKGDSKALAAAVEAAKGRPESHLVSNLVLRSMKKAVYRPENLGHYGLASEAYAHFTSPIRRYPDLVVHRMLKAVAASRRGETTPKFMAQKEALGWICEHSSEMERVAQTCARESQECKMCEYLAAFVGTEFDGVISGVATYGLFVRLENTAEGVVPLRRLGSEYFEFDPVRHMMRGQDTGVVYRLGMPIRVVLTASDPRTRSLSFRLA